MVKIFNRIYILSGAAVIIILSSCGYKYIIDPNTGYGDYNVRTQLVNFHINDSSYHFMAYIYPNGEFYVNSISPDTIKSNYTDYYFNKKGAYQKKYVQMKDSVVLNSYFPLLITNDSSIINHWEYPNLYEKYLVYEPYYSYFLHLTNEPILYRKNVLNQIRVTSCEEFIEPFDKPKTIFTIRLILSNDHFKLYDYR